VVHPLSICQHFQFKGITHEGFYIYRYQLRNPIIMHWSVKWYKEHENIMVCVPGLVGLLMDRWCIQILWIHAHLSTTFNLTLNCSLILTHASRSDQYCRAYPVKFGQIGIWTVHQPGSWTWFHKFNSTVSKLLFMNWGVHEQWPNCCS